MSKRLADPARTGRGLLFVVSSPSGAGKTTLVRRLAGAMRGIRPSVSATTRPPRPDERDGESYRFVTEEEFQRTAAQGGFVEWAFVHGRRYGTPLAEIERARRDSIDLVLSIDVQGARQIRSSGEPSIQIFILPPSWSELRRRLESRGHDAPEAIEGRLERGRREVPRASSYDYVVVNDVLEDAVEALRRIVEIERRLAGERDDG